MILYHFTYPEFVDSIMRDGLIPSDGSASAGGQSELTGPTLVGHACVFLTEQQTCRAVVGSSSRNADSIPVLGWPIRFELPGSASLLKHEDFHNRQATRKAQRFLLEKVRRHRV